MNTVFRQSLSALVVAAAMTLALGGAASTAFSLIERRAQVAKLQSRVEATEARESKPAPLSPRDPRGSPLFEAATVTQAGAALQERIASAVATAHGQLVSSRVEVAPRDDSQGLALAAELNVSQNDMQALLFDLESGRPYLFIDAVEARAPEPGGRNGLMRVSLSVSGQWSGAK